MRKNFAQILQENKINIRNEYIKLYALMHLELEETGNVSAYKIFSKNFTYMRFRGTALTLEEFDNQNGFMFADDPKKLDLNYLVLFCEYFYNLIIEYSKIMVLHPEISFSNKLNIQLYIEQITKVIDAIGYTENEMDGFTIFVEKSPVAIAVAEIVDDELSYKVIAYNHHSLAGNLPEKKNILLKFAEKLEPKRKQIESFNKSLSDDLFFCFNNLNIRHNNIDKWGSDYRELVAKMSNDKLEKWYDDIYQMSLLAFLCLEQKEIKNNVKTLKESFNPPKTE